MHFLRRWLHVERPPGVALRPARILELQRPAAEAFADAAAAVEGDLGGHVVSSKPHEALEAAFGLVNSERLTISIEPTDESSCRVTIQSRAHASPQPVVSSQYVDVLADLLAKSG